MDPNLSTSFIPKRPFTAGAAPVEQHRSAVGALSVLAVVIVLTTIIAFVAVYLSERSVESQKVSLQNELNVARDGLGTEFVADMKELNERINGVKALVGSHIVVTPIFNALQATTLRSVQYKTFGYQLTTDPTTGAKLVEVSITGNAKSYATLALQSDAYSQAPIIKNPLFSALVLDEKSSSVGFKLTFTVDPADLSYTTFINSLNPSAQSITGLTSGPQQ